MQSPSLSPQHESWLRCRRSLASRVAQDPLFAIPVQAIDWAVAQGIAERTHASLSLDRLVISDAEPQAEGGSMLVLIPKTDSVELRLYRDAGLAEQVDIDRSHVCEQLGRLVSQFHPAPLQKLIRQVRATQERVIKRLDLEGPVVYVFLMDRFAHIDVSVDLVFQFLFRSFYRLDSAGLTKQFKAEYFATLQRLRSSDTIDIEALAKQFYEILTSQGRKSLQFSFITKLAHTICPCWPIYDSEVVRVFGPVFGFTPSCSGKFDQRVKKHITFYERLRTTYQTILTEKMLEGPISLFRQRFAAQAEAIGDVKTLDFIFWSVGKLINEGQFPLRS